MDDSRHPPADASPAWAEALGLAARLARWAMLALAPAYLLSGIHILDPHEQAAVMVLGRLRGGAAAIWGPGVHWTLPRPFARVLRVDAGRVRSALVGSPLRPPAESAADPIDEDLWRHATLTAGAGLVRARWAMRFTIADPAEWLFGAADAPAVVSNEFRRAVIHATARTDIDAALRTDVDGLRGRIEAEVRERLGRRGVGVRIVRVEAVELVPPAAVAAAFDDVVLAAQERSARIDEARQYAARQAHEASGEAARRIAAAAAARDRWVAETMADADYFRRLLPQYRRDPAMVRQVLWQDAVRRGLEQAGEIHWIRPAPDGRQELRLWLGPEAARPGDHADLR